MSDLLAATPAPQSAATAPLRVMLVDDSAVVRGLTARWLAEEPDLQVVASCRTGRAALDELTRVRAEVVVLDIEMPDMDGLTALPLLLKAKPGIAVVMASTLTRRSADISLRCLALGAADYLAKPGLAVGHAEYQRELVAKIRALGEMVRRRAAASASHRPALQTLARFAAARPAAPDHNHVLRPFSVTAVRAIVIGASTGGPQALAALLKAIGPAIGRVPVIVTQHMPATFTAALAEHLAVASGRPASEAAHGAPLHGGAIYVAPGGRHLKISDSCGVPKAAIENGPAINFCKPSVDPLFRSAAEVYGSGLLAVMLTGMGADGRDGVRAVTAAGGSVIAQDQATSVVWGMPGAAAATGCCSAVLPLPEIGPRILRLLAGARA